MFMGSRRHARRAGRDSHRTLRCQCVNVLRPRVQRASFLIHTVAMRARKWLLWLRKRPTRPGTLSGQSVKYENPPFSLGRTKSLESGAPLVHESGNRIRGCSGLPARDIERELPSRCGSGTELPGRRVSFTRHGAPWMRCQVGRQSD